jgi:hypothetical protein
MDDITIAQAQKWLMLNEIEVNEKDYNGKKGLYVIVGGDFALELSNEEIEYRAELYREQNDEEII